ncbi:MAG: 16S rRNA (cytidine(1402)-2'-O)-methyltransferase [Synergistaceae bacterium]|jgi:16S rRNA (cytidine1402-2'-O)-methyltransferase|nr:16S rRNA (cytidine(1402)-2'-O)-methyltransferase [Synergistaceae bacterium]
MPLVIVPTPVGNLDDMTLRGLEALRNADVIACEDTRRTLKLLNRYDIRKPLISYHMHNERTRTGEILDRLGRGENVALVSDAGTPGISDPGQILAAAAIEGGFPVDALPGANALLPALLMSGIVSRGFHFAGFVGGSDSQVASALSELSDIRDALIFYVAPHDLASFLDLALHALGERRAALVREISKVHQEAVRGMLEELVLVSRTRELKGEMVLVVEGAGSPRPDVERSDWKFLATAMKKEGIWDKIIASVLFESYGIARNTVKKFLSREAAENERERK